MKPLKVALIGEVDSGKSTTLGQILIQTGSVLPYKLSEVAQTCERLKKDFEPAFLLDAFEFEREKEMTLDITSTYCRWFGDELQFLDTPGHRELGGKFIGGAADSDYALLVLDGQLEPKARHFRHLRSLFCLGLTRFAVVINKIREQDDAKFARLVEEVQYRLREYKPDFILPVEAKSGRGFNERNTYIWSKQKPFLSGLKQHLLNVGPSKKNRAVVEKNGFLRVLSGGVRQALFYSDGSPLDLSKEARGPHQILRVDPKCPQGPVADLGQALRVNGITARIVKLNGFSEMQSEFRSELQFKFGNFGALIERISSDEVRVEFDSPVSIFSIWDESDLNRDNIFLLKRGREALAVGVPIL